VFDTTFNVSRFTVGRLTRLAADFASLAAEATVRLSPPRRSLFVAVRHGEQRPHETPDPCCGARSTGGPEPRRHLAMLRSRQRRDASGPLRLPDAVFRMRQCWSQSLALSVALEHCGRLSHGTSRQASEPNTGRARKAFSTASAAIICGPRSGAGSRRSSASGGSSAAVATVLQPTAGPLPQRSRELGAPPGRARSRSGPFVPAAVFGTLSQAACRPASQVPSLIEGRVQAAQPNPACSGLRFARR
jgi:hypothetical protein